MPKSLQLFVFYCYYCNCFIIFITINHLYAGIYNYAPETYHVSRVYSVAAVLYLQSVLHVMLFCP